MCPHGLNGPCRACTNARSQAAYRERHGDARRAYNREYMRAARGGLKPAPPPAEPCKHGRVGWCKACWAKRARDAKKAAGDTP